MKQERMEEDEKTPEPDHTKPCSSYEDDSELKERLISLRLNALRECSQCHEGGCPVKSELMRMALRAM